MPLQKWTPTWKWRCGPWVLCRGDGGFPGGLDLVVDACDAPSAKALLRLGARDRRMPLIMETNDRGLLDIERYDLEETEDFLHGRTTAEQLTELAGGGAWTPELLDAFVDLVCHQRQGQREPWRSREDPWWVGRNCTAMWPWARNGRLRLRAAFYSGKTSQINASDSISMSSSPSHIPRESVDVARGLREATLHVFASSDDLTCPAVCRWAQSGSAVLGHLQPHSLWRRMGGRPDTTLFLLTCRDEEVLLSGMRLQKRRDHACHWSGAVGPIIPK